MESKNEPEVNYSQKDSAPEYYKLYIGINKLHIGKYPFNYNSLQAEKGFHFEYIYYIYKILTSDDNFNIVRGGNINEDLTLSREHQSIEYQCKFYENFSKNNLKKNNNKSITKINISFKRRPY